MTKPRPSLHPFTTWCRRIPFARALRRTALLALAAVLFASGAHATTTPAAPELPAVQEALAGLAVPFEQNTGQFEPEVAYLARTFAGAVFVTRDGRLVYSLPGKEIETAAEVGATPAAHLRGQSSRERGPGWALEERLLDARPLAPQGTTPAVTHVTRFTPKGTFQAETWQGVRLGEAWAGIEVELAARGRNFEKLFHVAPGADPEAIRVGLHGAEGVQVAADGRLIVGTGNGEIAYTAPVAWQEIGGERHPVAARYALLAPAAGAAEAAYGFALGAYDRRHPLTIDPLIQSTYLGGNAQDMVHALAVAADGDLLVGGTTQSSDFPGTANGAMPSLRNTWSGFIARLSPGLTSLRQSTYLGGGHVTYLHTLSLAANGDVLVGGYTNANDFPGTDGGAQPSLNGYTDGFVARLTGDLRTLIRSTYLGGSDADWVNSLTLTSDGDVVVGGETSSYDLPGSADGAQPSYGGEPWADGFVARLSGDLRTLRRSTYLGGSDSERIGALVLAANGDLLVGGATQSVDFPGTSGGAQASNGGDYDGFVARLTGDLRTLLQSTYLGGGGSDRINTLGLAPDGVVLVGGTTASADLPGTAGGAQPNNAGDHDGFVSRLSGDLRTLLRSTYFGGSERDGVQALVLAADGDLLVAGTTWSADLPGTANGLQAAFGGGGYDGFVARLSGNLQTLLQSTYFGGRYRDGIGSLVLAADGDLLVGGTTWSEDLPGTGGGAQPSYGGSYWDEDGFVARLSSDLREGPPIAPPEPCVPSATKLCLNDGRFHVTVRWRYYHETGDGQAVARTHDSGLFWFFNPTNLEMLVKVLDGCALNGHYWVFAAATTDVEYELTVRDALTGVRRDWRNPLGVASPAITDTEALAVCP